MKKNIFCFLFLNILLGLNSAAATAGQWNQFKASHFIIYYQDAPPDFVKEVEKSANAYYDEIARNMGFTRYKGWTWDERARIYIYNNYDHYMAESRSAGWSAGHAYTRDKVIRTFPAAHGFFDTTLPHELGHIIFREFIGENAHVPLWFEEGVAMYQEKARRWGAHRAVKEAIENKTFIPLPEFDRIRLYKDTPAETVSLYYTQAASVVNYLITGHGQTRFVRFCRQLQEGKLFMEALRSVYARFDSLEKLNRDWIRFLKNE